MKKPTIVLLMTWAFSPTRADMPPASSLRFRVILKPGTLSAIVETVAADSLGDDGWVKHGPGPTRIDPNTLIACALRRVLDDPVVLDARERAAGDIRRVPSTHADRTVIDLGTFRAEED